MNPLDDIIFLMKNEVGYEEWINHLKIIGVFDELLSEKRATAEDSPNVLTKPEKTTGICDFLDVSMYNDLYDKWEEK